MPLITLTVRKPKTAAFKTIVLDAVHHALVSVGVPQADVFQRVLELSAEDFRFDAQYPDVDATKGARDDNFVLIELLWSVGRSVKVKRQFLAALMTRCEAQGLNPENLMVVFKETQWENWSFAGGRQIHV
jgi:phenylpyruvate tautomerase PptA (4-oxalocrotonate tautomerase family)